MTAKISDKFSQDFPYTSNTFSRESPRFQTGFQLSTRSPSHSKENPGKLDNVEIEIFEVRSPLWVERSEESESNEYRVTQYRSVFFTL